MPKTLVDLRSRPLLDIVSHGRGGPKGSIRLSPDQIAAIDRTVRRVPEVMVKVLPKHSNNLRSVARHFNYIGRYGRLELETDDGDRIQGKDAGQRLLEDWDLDLDKDRREMGLASVPSRSPKLVHKIMLSMPPGTPAKGVLDAARTFAREEFALKHRYALALHIDEPHPHVHLVVKAVSEQGVRLNIRKATLRGWRREFARYLREQGIAANATERVVRGETRRAKKDGIYRASLRGESTHVRAQAEAIAGELRKGHVHIEPGKKKLVETRKRSFMPGIRSPSGLPGMVNTNSQVMFDSSWGGCLPHTRSANRLPLNWSSTGWHRRLGRELSFAEVAQWSIPCIQGFCSAQYSTKWRIPWVDQRAGHFQGASRLP